MVSEGAKGLLVHLIIVPWIITGIYAAVRKAGDRWWLGAGLGGFVVILLIGMIAPVFISPILDEATSRCRGTGQVRDLFARPHQPDTTDNVVFFDASKQTTGSVPMSPALPAPRKSASTTTC